MGATWSLRRAAFCSTVGTVHIHSCSYAKLSCISCDRVRRDQIYFMGPTYCPCGDYIRARYLCFDCRRMFKQNVRTDKLYIQESVTPDWICIRQTFVKKPPTTQQEVVSPVRDLTFVMTNYSIFDRHILCIHYIVLAVETQGEELVGPWKYHRDKRRKHGKISGRACRTVPSSIIAI